MAVVRWLGTAKAVKQVNTITIANTWATADTLTVTINGNDIVLTAGSAVATTDIATALKELFNGDTATESSHTFDPPQADGGGQAIPEFTELVATVSGSVVTLTGVTAGKPVTLSVSESTAGSGTATLATPTAATGPNHVDNGDNWSGGAVPSDSDDVVFDSGDIDALYALDQNGVTLSSLTITQGYTGNIGLPETNEDNSAEPYREYRDQYLAFGNSGDATTTTITIGEGDGQGSGRIKINSGTGQAVLNVHNSGQRAETDVAAIVWKGTHASNVVNLVRGDLAIAPVAGETSAVATLRVGFVSNEDGDSTLYMGDGMTLTDVDISGGNVTIQDATTTLDVYGGEVHILNGAHADIDIDGGSVFYRSTGTLTTARVGGGGTLDFRRDLQSRTVTNAEIHAGGTILDSYQTVTWSNGVDLNRCNLDEVTLDLGTHLTLTPSAI